MSRRKTKTLAAIVIAATGTLATAASAAALEPCPDQPDARVIYGAPGSVFESVAVDRRGRLFFTNSTSGELLMIRRSGAKPRVVLDGIDGPGGIVFRRNGNVIVGFGDTFAQGSDGEENPEAGLIEVDPRTGAGDVFVDGLQMANGVTRGPGGQIFASTDFGSGVDRIIGGGVELGWAPIESSNGMVVDRRKRNLFVNQTFTNPPTIRKVPLDDPTASVPWFTAPSETGAFLDGLTRDADNNLYAAANGGGAVWRVSSRHSACVLWQGRPFPSGPSDVAFGRGKGRFPKGSLFVTTFGGELVQLRHAR
jgi:sugar lactone lactonase YvrE